MAVAAFKSSARRGNLVSASTASSSGRESREDKPKKAPIRRSRSVSVMSRTSLDVSAEFVNKRDNPLFCGSISPGDDDIESGKSVLAGKFDEFASNSGSVIVNSANSAPENGRSGRSVSRNGELSSKGLTGRRETGRSLSRVDTGRVRRSASQCPVSRRRHLLSSESEAEQECNSRQSKVDGKILNLIGSHRKGNSSRDNSAVSDETKNRRTWSCQHLPFEASDGSSAASCLQTQDFDDTISIASSASRSEEKTIKAVFEQMKSVEANGSEASSIYETVRSEVRRAISEIQNDLESAIRMSNPTGIAVTSVTDIPPDMVNPGAVELVLDIRREYSIKLEESQERARILRADLAVEEHRGQELDRILKEVLPYPKTPNAQKSRPARKASIERRRMSKRLAEDAMAYFDECVSLSTFDSSDFSSQEDPSLNLVGPPTLADRSVCLPEESGTQGKFKNNHRDILQATAGTIGTRLCQDQNLSTPGSAESNHKFQFSILQKPSEASGFHPDIHQCIKKCAKNDLESSTQRSTYCDLGKYSHQPTAESLLIDKVLFKSRIESGNLLLCGGGITMSSRYCGIRI